MTPKNQKMRNSLKDIEAHITAALAQQPEDDAKCGQHLYDALTYAFNAADSACHECRVSQPVEGRRQETGVRITKELRDLSRNIRQYGVQPLITVYGKPIDVYFDELADRIDAAVKNEVSVEFRRSQVVVAELTRRLDEAQPKPDPDWNEICAKCRDGEVEPEDCEYYGDPNGCNSPIIGRHPRTKCDTAKLREAASQLASIFDCDIQFLETHAKELKDGGAYGGGIIEHILHCITLARKALATPPRNCNKYDTPEKAFEAHLRYCRAHPGCRGCKWSESPCCDYNWLYAAANESEVSE